MLDRRWLTNNGHYVQKFEQEICDYLEVKYCTVVANGTIALEIMARAAGLYDEVIVPAFTCVATPHALAWQGMTPVFCDIDPLTHNIDPLKVEALITPRTTGILAVHLWGRPCDTDKLELIAIKHDLKIVFDACHAFGNSHQGIMIGNFGDAEAFSFHATKYFNSFEGGAIVTNDEKIAERVKLMVNFGYKFQQPNEVYMVGTNGKMTEIAAAMGLVSLDSIDEFTKANLDNYDLYCALLRDVPGITPIKFDARELSNRQHMIVEVDDEIADISRDELVEVLARENILGQRLFCPACHKAQPYLSMYPGLSLPEAERMSTRTLSLPTSMAVGMDDIVRVCDVIRKAVIK